MLDWNSDSALNGNGGGGATAAADGGAGGTAVGAVGGTVVAPPAGGGAELAPDALPGCGGSGAANSGGGPNGEWMAAVGGIIAAEGGGGPAAGTAAVDGAPLAAGGAPEPEHVDDDEGGGVGRAIAVVGVVALVAAVALVMGAGESCCGWVAGGGWLDWLWGVVLGVELSEVEEQENAVSVNCKLAKLHAIDCCRAFSPRPQGRRARLRVRETRCDG